MPCNGIRLSAVAAKFKKVSIVYRFSLYNAITRITLTVKQITLIFYRDTKTVNYNL